MAPIREQPLAAGRQRSQRQKQNLTADYADERCYKTRLWLLALGPGLVAWPKAILTDVQDVWTVINTKQKLPLPGIRPNAASGW